VWHHPAVSLGPLDALALVWLGASVGLRGGRAVLKAIATSPFDRCVIPSFGAFGGAAVMAALLLVLKVL
jgi:hypothetical protein